MSLFANTIAQTITASDERALRSQLKRSAASVPTNIVEGRAQSIDAEFARMLAQFFFGCIR